MSSPLDDSSDAAIAASSSSVTSSLSARTESRILLVLTIMTFTNVIDFMSLMPLSPHLMREFKINATQFGLLVSVYAIMAAAAALVASGIADRYDRKSLLLFLYAGLVVCALGSSLALTYSALLVMRALAGVFCGVLSSMVYTVVGDLVPNERRGRANARIMTAMAMASIVGVPAALWIAAHWHWRWALVTNAVLAFVVWFIAKRTIPSLRGHITDAALAPFSLSATLESYREVVLNVNHAWVFAMTGLNMFAHFCIVPFVAPSLIANAGVNERDIAYFYLAGGIASLVTRPLLGKWVDRYPRPRVLLVLCVFCAIPVIIITHSWAHGIWANIPLAMMMFTFAGGRFTPVTTIAASATLPHMRARVMAFNSAVANLGSASAALITGSLIHTSADGHFSGFENAGYLSLAVSVLVVLAAFRVRQVG